MNETGQPTTMDTEPVDMTSPDKKWSFSFFFCKKKNNLFWLEEKVRLCFIFSAFHPSALEHFSFFRSGAVNLRFRPRFSSSSAAAFCLFFTIFFFRGR